MLCTNPYSPGGAALYPCGQCMPCRLNRRRLWTHRIMLEALQHSQNAFVTLTYSEDALPKLTSEQSSDTLPTLNPKDLQNWLKRLRKEISPLRIRYYAVGEYGDQTNRPHYHLALFNYPSCTYGTSAYTSRRTSCCAACDTVLRTWGKGLVSLGTLETSAAQYIAGYVTKKMTKQDDPRLLGRYPEFARMSNRPGLAADAVHEIASQLLTFNLDTTQTDVPSALRHGNKLLPLGRYLRRKLRLAIGKDEKAPQEVIDQLQATLSHLYMDAEAVTQAPGFARFRSMVYRDKVIEHHKGKVASLEARSKIFKKRGTI